MYGSKFWLSFKALLVIAVKITVCFKLLERRKIFIDINLYYHLCFLDPLPTEGLMKSLLSVCLSIHPPTCLSVRPSIRPSVHPSIHQFGILLRNDSLVFSNFWHDDRSLEYLKTGRVLFFQANSFLPKFKQKVPEMPPK